MNLPTKSTIRKKVGVANPTSTRMTIEDVQRMGTFFRELIESTHLKKWIVLAGLGGLCELLRLGWDVFKFLQGVR